MSDYGIEDHEERGDVHQMRWSFSRLSSFYVCPYAWKLKYIYRLPEEQNFFSEYGTFCHSIFERYFKGEIDAWDLLQIYEDGIDWAITSDAPKIKRGDMADIYFKQGEEYFSHFHFDAERYEVLGVEKQIEFTISEKPFVGFIDLLLRDKTDGGIIVVDHKSGKSPILKTGLVSSQHADKLEKYLYQLYLYSIAVENEYGERPKGLWLNFFRSDYVYKTTFDDKCQNAALRWAKDTVSAIETETAFSPRPVFYWCQNVCGYRNRVCKHQEVMLNNVQNDTW